MAMEGTILRKERFKDESGERYEKCQQLFQHQSIIAENSWVMTMHQTDKEHVV